MRFSKQQYTLLNSFAFRDDNPGFNKSIIESPNGDGIWDNHKQYSHIAPKYFKQLKPNYPLKKEVEALYNKAVAESEYVCDMLGIPKQFWSGYDSTLRILRYPAGAVTAPHTDFNLFTLCMYRDDESAFKYLSGERDPLLLKARKVSPGIHFGEIMTEINGAQATEHEVVATDDWQYSAVFFAVPEHNIALPSGTSIESWMLERKSRSRTVKRQRL